MQSNMPLACTSLRSNGSTDNADVTAQPQVRLTAAHAASCKQEVCALQAAVGPPWLNRCCLSRLHCVGRETRPLSQFNPQACHQNCQSSHIKHPRHRSITMVRNGMQRSEEHTSELQSLMSISYAVFCLKKKK